MNAVRTRGSYQHSRQKSFQRQAYSPSPSRNAAAANRISEESGLNQESLPVKPLPEQTLQYDDSGQPSEPGPEPKSPEKPSVGATLSGPIEDTPVHEPHENGEIAQPISARPEAPARSASRKLKSPSHSPTYAPQFVPEDSPQPGKELTLFLQYKTKIKKCVLEDGSNDLSMARLQLAFIEKFAWNTHNNGVELPEIYIQDPVSGVRHELEDLSDIRDRSVLVLNIEMLDEVKNHIDAGLGDLRGMMEKIKTSVDDQQAALSRVSQRQQETARDIAGIAAAPPPTSRPSALSPPTSSSSGGVSAPRGVSPAGTAAPNDAATLNDLRTLRRDLAIVRQTYTTFTTDVQNSMSQIRQKASTIKSVAAATALPSLAGDSGRAYINAGKSSLQEDERRVVARVDDIQDAIEDLRKDVVSRGVRPLPRQLEDVGRELSEVTQAVKRLREFMRREKPLWTKIWEAELQTVCEERDLLSNSEELLVDLEADLEQAGGTLGLVEQATRQQNLQAGGGERGSGDGAAAAAAAAVGGGIGGMGVGGQRSASRNLQLQLALDQTADPRKAKDDMLGQVKALEVKTEDRLEAIARAEKLRQKELESRKEGELFKKELGSFVEEGKLKKSGGVEEVERQRLLREERARREFEENVRLRRVQAQQKREEEAAAAAAAAAAAEQADAEQDAGGQDDGAPAPPAKDDADDDSEEFVEAKEKVATPPNESS